MKMTNLVIIFLFISIVLCFVNLLIGLPCLLVCCIYFIVQGTKNLSRVKQCSLCGKKLNINNTGVGGRLKDGGQLCTSCLQSLSVDIAASTEKYNIEEIIVFQEAEKERRRLAEMAKKKKQFDAWLSSVRPVLQQGETVVHLIRAEYNKEHGILSLTNERLLFVYLKPIKKLASSGFFSAYYANLVTHENIPTSAITDVQVRFKFRGAKIRIYIADFIMDIDCYCQKNEAAEMVEQIKERVRNTPPSNITINITQTNSE